MNIEHLLNKEFSIYLSSSSESTVTSNLRNDYNNNDSITRATSSNNNNDNPDKIRIRITSRNVDLNNASSISSSPLLTPDNIVQKASTSSSKNITCKTSPSSSSPNISTPKSIISVFSSNKVEPDAFNIMEFNNDNTTKYTSQP